MGGCSPPLTHTIPFLSQVWSSCYRMLFGLCYGRSDAFPCYHQPPVAIIGITAFHYQMKSALCLMPWSSPSYRNKLRPLRMFQCHIGFIFLLSLPPWLGFIGQFHICSSLRFLCSIPSTSWTSVSPHNWTTIFQELLHLNVVYANFQGLSIPHYPPLLRISQCLHHWHLGEETTHYRGFFYELWSVWQHFWFLPTKSM